VTRPAGSPHDTEQPDDPRDRTRHSQLRKIDDSREGESATVDIRGGHDRTPLATRHMSISTALSKTTLWIFLHSGLGVFSSAPRSSQFFCSDRRTAPSSIFDVLIQRFLGDGFGYLFSHAH
jgi:hypothetical protein